MTSIQPELWVDRAAEAVAFYQAAFGAIVLHRVGAGEDVVAQLAIGNAAFWVARAGSAGQRLRVLFSVVARWMASWVHSASRSRTWPRSSPVEQRRRTSARIVGP